MALDSLNISSTSGGGSLMLRSHRLERLLTGSIPVPQETVVDQNGEIVVNEAFEDFMAQDSALASWLLSTISLQLLPQFVDAETAAAVWDKVTQFFANRATTTVMNLLYKLQSLKKGDDIMRVYLNRVKEVCDALESCGSHVAPVEQIVSVLKGLPREYLSFMAVITTMRENPTLEIVSSMLIDVETQLTGFEFSSESLPMSSHVAQAASDS
ncbi:uncharacterized protein LOC120152761 [Hibiscus syriacus]|uniref:uncharacterized protein LOC120152761 n=1 Tax=Hibiscus syriacus TaxID=106335 RepID=UPI001924C93A|nr:uncharacterized protein LOC120152761 [Hibiscus syriacus]